MISVDVNNIEERVENEIVPMISVDVNNIEERVENFNSPYDLRGRKQH